MLSLLNCRLGLAPNVWVWVFFFVCGGAKKGCELLRNIDEVYCNLTAYESFHTVIGVLVPLRSKSCNLFL